MEDRNLVQTLFSAHLRDYKLGVFSTLSYSGYLCYFIVTRKHFHRKIAIRKVFIIDLMFIVCETGFFKFFYKILSENIEMTLMTHFFTIDEDVRNENVARVF